MSLYPVNYKKESEITKLQMFTAYNYFDNTRHIFLTTYLILLHTELYEFAANQNLGIHNS